MADKGGRGVWTPFFWLIQFLNSPLQNSPGYTRSVIQSLTEGPFSFKSLKHHYFKTLEARKLKFKKNVNPPTNVTCHISCVTCHVLRVMSQVSHITLKILSVQSGISYLIKGHINEAQNQSSYEQYRSISLFHSWPSWLPV